MHVCNFWSLPAQAFHNKELKQRLNLVISLLTNYYRLYNGPVFSIRRGGHDDNYIYKVLPWEAHNLNRNHGTYFKQELIQRGALIRQRALNWIITVLTFCSVSILFAHELCKFLQTASNRSISPHINDRVNKGGEKQRTLGQRIDDVKDDFILYHAGVMHYRCA